MIVRLPLSSRATLGVLYTICVEREDVVGGVTLSRLCAATSAVMLGAEKASYINKLKANPYFGARPYVAARKKPCVSG